MMIVTTLFVAAIIVAGLYFLAVRFIPWPGVSYALMIAVGVACLFPGDVRSGPANLDSAISGNSRYKDRLEAVWQEGVSDGEEEGFGTADPSDPQSRVQGAGGVGGVERRPHDG